MYLQHYGFRDKPFKLTHDPAYFYGEAHQVAMNELFYSIEERQGLALLLGEPGTGKTTLLLRMLRSFSKDLSGVFLSDIAVGEASLIRQVARALLIPFQPQDSTDAVAQYMDIFLRGQVTAGKTAVVLVDEAQGLTDGQFEELRLLTNLEHKGQKIVEVILAGLPSLERKFHTPDFESLSQRAVIRCWVEPFAYENVKEYIQHRLEVVGAPNRDMFTDEAVERVHHASRGIPRLINIVCERTLLIGYVEEQQVIKAPHVDQAVADLNLKPSGDDGIAQNSGAFGLEGDLLMKMTSKLDEVLRKLDGLERHEAPSGVASDAATTSTGLSGSGGRAPAQDESSGSSGARKWLKPSPTSSVPPQEASGREPFDDLVDTMAAQAVKTAKGETNH